MTAPGWLGQVSITLAECGSTSDVAASWARGELEGQGRAPHGAVVIADAQTRGRGRLGRSWHSPPGESLYFSAVLRPTLEPRRIPPLTLTAAVALAEAVLETGVTPELKWPNDVLVGGRKLAGILTELVCAGQRIDFVVLGIGVNLNNERFPPELAASATSLGLVLGRRIEREAFVRALCERLEVWYERFTSAGPAPVIAAWKEHARMLGGRVTVTLGGPKGPGQKAETITGVAEDLDLDGMLVVRGEDGSVVRVVAGEVAL